MYKVYHNWIMRFREYGGVMTMPTKFAIMVILNNLKFMYYQRLKDLALLESTHVKHNIFLFILKFLNNNLPKKTIFFFHHLEELTKILLTSLVNPILSKHNSNCIQYMMSIEIIAHVTIQQIYTLSRSLHQKNRSRE